MKWELVVTDPNAGKTGRVRVEAPDQAAAERIAADKGWVVSSARPFEPNAAPVAPPAAEPAPPDPAADAEPASDPAPPPAFGYPVPSDTGSDEAEEDRPKPVVMPLEKGGPSRPTGATLPYPPTAAVVPRREVTPAPAAVPVVAQPKAPRNGFPVLMAFLFWVGGIALIAGGAIQLAYYFGFNPHNGFNETGDATAATANRLAEIKALMRALVGGVYIVGGLLAATLGTMLARPPKK